MNLISLNDLYEYFLRLKKGFLTLLPQEAFTFIITRENGKYNFGYCLIENDFNGNISTAHCILRFVFYLLLHIDNDFLDFLDKLKNWLLIGFSCATK